MVLLHNCDRLQLDWLRFSLGWLSLGVACSNSAVLDGSLDEPVVIVVASNAAVNAGGAQVEVSLFALSTVVVLTLHSSATVVAVDGECVCAEIIESRQSRYTKFGLASWFLGHLFGVFRRL